METDTGTNNASDRDRTMAGHFESYFDSPDSKERKKKKKQKSESNQANESRGTAAAEEKQAENREKTEEKQSLYKFFEAKEPESDEKEEKSEEASKSTISDEQGEPLEPLEASADPEKLAEDERRLIAERLITARRQELGRELSAMSDDQEPEPEIVSAATFINNLEKTVASSDGFDEAVIDEAANRTIEELNLPTAETAEEPDEVSRETEETVPDTVEPAAVTPEVAPAEEPEPEPKSVTPPGPAAPPPINGGAGANGSGVGPPSPGRPGRGFVPPIGPTLPTDHVPFNPNIVSASLDIKSPLAKPEVAPRSYQRAADLLVGGIVGYLIGRRRGRIKTEERLVPIQQKLEREVKDLHEKIVIKEEQVRKLTAQKEAESQQQPVLMERSKSIQPEAMQRSQLEIKERAVISERQENTPLYTKRIPERLGRVVLVPERSAAVQPETRTTPVAVAEVAAMAVPEMLQIAKNVKVDGVSAEQLYQQRRLDSEGLRRVVTEYVRGGDPERMLTTELKNWEAKLAQSPEFMPHDATGGAAASAGSAATASQTQSPPQSPAATQPDTPAPNPVSDQQFDDMSSASGGQQRVAGMALAAGGALILLLAILLLL